MIDSEKLITRTLSLNASTSEVWDALTNPEKTRRYLFNCEVSSSWEVGEPITWTGYFQGYESGKRGRILECENEKKLSFTSFDPDFGLNDVEENYLHITYWLIPRDGRTELTITIENFNDDPARMGHITFGWENIVMPAFKELF